MIDDSLLSTLDECYRRDGWCRVALPRPEVLDQVRAMLEERLSELCGDPRATLPRYHEFVGDDQHEAVHWELASVFWERECGRAIGAANVALFRAFLGPDLYIQHRPFLRIARPGRREDNIGYHRDSFYGQSLYEVTVFIPLTPLDERGALRYVSGSHTRSDDDYGVVDLDDASWSKGSRKHLLGFPYAPKRITADISRQLVPVPLDVGQAVVFSPSVIHGQEQNRMPTTRVSFDLRLVHSFAPTKFCKEPGSRGYVPLSESAVAHVAERYYAANG